MNIDVQNTVDKSIDKFDNDFHRSFSTLDRDNEHRKSTVTEDDASSEKPLSSKNIEEENRSESTSSGADKPLTIANATSTQPSVNCFLQSHHDLPPIDIDRINVSSIDKNDGEKNHENKSKRKRGRPRKFFLEPETQLQEDSPPSEKRSRGRPRKHFSVEKEVKDKKPVGRPRIYFNTEPKEKKPIGRPRINFEKVRSESKEKRSRGRPRKYFNVVPKEKKPRGRPRSNLKLDYSIGKKSYSNKNFNSNNNESLRKRGRPRKTGGTESRKSSRFISYGNLVKNEVSSLEDNENDSFNGMIFRRKSKSKRKRGRPRKNVNVESHKQIPPLDDTSSIEDTSVDSTENSEDKWNSVMKSDKAMK